jgi:hypothetical protein
MNLEKKLDLIIDDYNLASEADGDSHRYRSMKDWRFNPDFIGSLESQPTISRILYEIEIADLNECLTSPHSFIRDYKSRKKE